MYEKADDQKNMPFPELSRLDPGGARTFRCCISPTHPTRSRTSPGHRRGRDGLFSIASEAQRSRRGHPQARAGPGSGPEANLGSGQQPQGNWHNKMYRAHIKCFPMNSNSFISFKALKVNLYQLNQASKSSETEQNVKNTVRTNNSYSVSDTAFQNAEESKGQED